MKQEAAPSRQRAAPLASDRTRYRTRLREHYLNCRPQEAAAPQSPRARSNGGEGDCRPDIYRRDPSRDSIDDKISHEQSPWLALITDGIVGHRLPIEKWHRTTELTVCQLCMPRLGSCFRRWRQCLVSTIDTHTALLPIIKIGIRSMTRCVILRNLA